MGMFNERSWAYIWAELIFVYLGTVFCAIVIAKHIYRVRLEEEAKKSGRKKVRKVSNENNFDDIVIHYGTILSVFLFAVQLPMRAFWRTAELSGYTSDSCYTLAICTAMLWVFSKLSMYAVFVARAAATFRGSTMAYRDITIRALYGVIVVHAVIMVILLAVYGDGRKGYASRKRNGNKKDGREDGMPICLAEHALSVLYYAAGTDFIFTALLVYLFTNPLMKLFRLKMAASPRGSVASKRSIREVQAQLLPLKSMLLSSVAVCSTAFALLFSAITAMAFVVYFDLCINLSCLLLFTRYWSETYWWVCSPVLGCFARSQTCFDREHREGLMQMLEYHKARRGMDDAIAKGIDTRPSGATI